MLPIETAETRFGHIREDLRALGRHVPDSRFSEVVPLAFGTRPLPVADTVAGTTLGAFVNDGRWIVQCDVCFGAQIAARGDRRFYCVDCGNASVGGAWRGVKWPPQADAIEALLTQRTLRKQQCWHWGQPLSDLAQMNVTLGLAEAAQ